MLILLGISSVIAFVIPEPQRNDSSPEQSVTGTTGETQTKAKSGESNGTESAPVSDRTEYATVNMEANRPEQVNARPGQRLILTVKTSRGADVEIEGLGLTGFADRFAPAVFDVILPLKADRFQVRAPGEKPRAVIVTGP
ncbi:MAG: hypothetical protein KDB64_05790 [Solirubrobacterales bacterium]|nr:hypothetical protein [Solirubrobacterales bacterium]MCB0862187.1 hypothetical protein [Solirubrobacterales bacterium]MCB8915273.1 hypothetical protein [Thermoleophilales bacterium]